MSSSNHDDMVQKNARTGLIVLACVLVMVGLAFASVPLYNVFCRVTGFGGTTQVATSLPDTVLDRRVTINFSTQTGRDMPWRFEPELRSVEVKLGERGLANFFAENPTDTPIAGTAVYNVTPLKVGKYFNKVQCFCFDEQILSPGERMNMPVMFYVDPAMNEDPDMRDVTTITLSYTFYKTESEALESALEEFYNGENGDI